MHINKYSLILYYIFLCRYNISVDILAKFQRCNTQRRRPIQGRNKHIFFINILMRHIFCNVVFVEFRTQIRHGAYTKRHFGGRCGGWSFGKSNAKALRSASCRDTFRNSLCLRLFVIYSTGLFF